MNRNKSDQFEMNLNSKRLSGLAATIWELQYPKTHQLDVIKLAVQPMIKITHDNNFLVVFCIQYISKAFMDKWIRREIARVSGLWEKCEIINYQGRLRE